MRAAIIDSSPLIFLSHLDLATKLAEFFRVVYVPSLVQQEVNRKHRFRYRLNKLYATGLFQRCHASNQTNRKLMEEYLGPGEAEALTQGQERGIRFFIGDERRARNYAMNMGICPIGTARLLARLNIEGYAENPRILIKRLRLELNCRIADDVVEAAIKEAPKPIIGPDY